MLMYTRRVLWRLEVLFSFSIDNYFLPLTMPGMNQIVRIVVMIVSMILSRFVDTTNPDTLLKVRIGYVVSVVINAAVFYYIRTIVRRTHDDAKIYIVNSMLGQEVVEETTYFEKEETMCTQATTEHFLGVFMSLGIDVI